MKGRGRFPTSRQGIKSENEGGVVRFGGCKYVGGHRIV